MGATSPSGLDQVAVKLPSPAGAAVRAPGAPGGVLSTFSVIGSAVARLPAASLTTAWSRCGRSATAAVWGAGALGVMCAQGMGRGLSQAPLSMVCWWPSTNQPASAIPVLSVPPKLALSVPRCQPSARHSGPLGPPVSVGALGSLSETSAAYSDIHTWCSLEPMTHRPERALQRTP